MGRTDYTDMQGSIVIIMDNLRIESTKKTPEIAFNADGRFRISGRSIPEDASKFYDELFDWVYAYCQTPAESTTVDIELEYFNSGSSKALLHVLRVLSEIVKKGSKLTINWYYEQGDDDIMERGEYYESILEIKFNFIET
jgi:hypothetical protein